MRIFGLLLLLGGSIVLALPLFVGLLHRSFKLQEGTQMGGALLCLGIAALLLSRAARRR